MGIMNCCIVQFHGGHGGNLKTLQTTSDSELLKAIGSDSQDGHHGTI